MIQHEISHPAHTFVVCACGHNPRHIEGRGSASNEEFDVMHPTGIRHSIECRCGLRTPWLPTLEAAKQQWRDLVTPKAVPVHSTRAILRLAR